MGHASLVSDGFITPLSMIYIIQAGKTGGRTGVFKNAPAPQARYDARAVQSGLLAPDTSGMNFYRADPALTDLLRIHLPDALFRAYRAASRPAGRTWPAAISTNARGSPTAMGRCCTSATSSAATCSGSNIIRPIASSSAPPSANSAFTRCRSARASWAGRTNILSSPSMPSPSCSIRPSSAWAARSTSPTAAQSCWRISAARR